MPAEYDFFLKKHIILRYFANNRVKIVLSEAFVPKMTVKIQKLTFNVFSTNGVGNPAAASQVSEKPPQLCRRH